MTNILFPTDTTWVTPASWDIIIIADVSDSSNPKDCTLAELPISTATQTALDAKANLSGWTFTGDINVPAEVYGAGWNGSNEVPTKNDLYDKIETISGGGVTDHWALTGLADDDHTQYTKADGTRAFTGKQSYSTHPTFSADTELVDKKYVDDAVVAGGWYTDEQAQDAVGAILVDSGRIDFTYNDATPSITADIIDDSVTFAKVQNINTNRILGRSTAGTGDIEELNVTAVPALIGLGMSDSPQFTAVNVWHATDSTITRVSAGVLAIEWNNIVTSNTTSSTTQSGIVELATTAEINTGTDSTRAIPVDQYVASNRNVRYFDIYAIDKASDNAVGTNICGSIECPFTGTITEIGAYVETAWVTGASVWDVNKNGTTIMTTNKLSIDSAEVSTRTAATAPTLTTTAITAGDLITIDTDSLSTTKPRWLHIRIWIRLT